MCSATQSFDQNTYQLTMSLDGAASSSAGIAMPAAVQALVGPPPGNAGPTVPGAELRGNLEAAASKAVVAKKALKSASVSPVKSKQKAAASPARARVKKTEASASTAERAANTPSEAVGVAAVTVPVPCGDDDEMNEMEVEKDAEQERRDSIKARLALRRLDKQREAYDIASPRYDGGAEEELAKTVEEAGDADDVGSVDDRESPNKKAKGIEEDLAAIVVNSGNSGSLAPGGPAALAAAFAAGKDIAPGERIPTTPPRGGGCGQAIVPAAPGCPYAAAGGAPDSNLAAGSGLGANPVANGEGLGIFRPEQIVTSRADLAATINECVANAMGPLLVNVQSAIKSQSEWLTKHDGLIQQHADRLCSLEVAKQSMATKTDLAELEARVLAKRQPAQDPWHCAPLQMPAARPSSSWQPNGSTSSWSAWQPSSHIAPPQPHTSSFGNNGMAGSANDWAATKLFMRGWSDPDDRERSGISSTEAAKQAQELLKRLNQTLRERVTGTAAPYGKNSQIVLHIKGGTEACWETRNHLAQSLQENPLLVNGKAVYIVVENPPWKAERNQVVSKARSALRRQLPASMYGSLDVRYYEGSIYDRKSEDSVCIGRWSRRGWRWFEPTIRTQLPMIDVPRLRTESGLEDSD